jgi:5-methylcytosine-specific restriction endonuclease McrA
MSSRNSAEKEGSGEIVPAGVLLVSLIFGGYIVWNRPFGGSTGYVWWIFLVASILGILYVGWGFRVVTKQSGMFAAVNWLFANSRNNKSHSSPSNDTTEKTPPPPESLKNELYFQRADRRCEWCEERVDSPDVHHIMPRSEGGPNTPKNLIVLCPNCHRKADSGTISRSKLKYRVNEQLADLEV